MVLIFFVFTLWSSLSLASDPATQNQFGLGLSAYQSKDYQKAQQIFHEMLELDPQNEALLTNLGLAHYALDQKGLALAYFRRSLAYFPSFFSAARMGTELVAKNLNPRDNSDQIDPLTHLHRSFLVYTPLSLLIFLGAILFFISGWSLMGFFATRKKAIENETLLPRVSLVSILSLLLFLICSGLTVLKTYDLTLVRATVVTKEAALFIAPDESQMKLYDLHEGFEVIIKNSQNDWVQVKFPGQNAGWIKREFLQVTAGGGST